ncbi:MAG: S6e family ribosomal protein [Candidatus Woesearchaeota archaeon]|jgi:small subunit ribosomal protein S6e
MAKFHVSVGDAKKGSGRTYKFLLENDDTRVLMGKKIGDKVQLAQTKDNILEVTGGSDASGFPMRKDLDGVQKKKIFLASGIGYNPKRKGCKDRKTVAGNTIFEGTAQVNLKVSKEGKEKLEVLFPKEEKAEDKKE